MYRVITESYKVGDVVEQEMHRGSRLVLVTSRERDVKRGLPGFDGLLVNESGETTEVAVWGYDHSVMRVAIRNRTPGHPSNT